MSDSERADEHLIAHERCDGHIHFQSDEIDGYTNKPADPTRTGCFAEEFEIDPVNPMGQIDLERPVNENDSAVGDDGAEQNEIGGENVV
jgi:hypothetical protein